MNLKDIFKEVNKALDANIVDVVDMAVTFAREHAIKCRWKYEYEITMSYSGTATSAAATMTDSTAAFAVDGTLIGQTINNVTDGSSGTITAATATKITATLSGGTNNTWAISDAYTITLSNNIHLPKSINTITTMNIDDIYIPLTLRYEGFRNENSDAYDDYSANTGIQTPQQQACQVLEDYVMRFVDNLSATTMRLYCEKVLTNDISESDLTTELSLPDKMLMPMSYFILHRLFMLKKYQNIDYSIFYRTLYKEYYKKAVHAVNKAQTSRTNLGKSGGRYGFQNTRSLR